MESRTSIENETASIGQTKRTNKIPAMRFVAVLDSRSQMVSMISADLGAKDGESFLIPDWSNLSSFCAFPEGDVKVGDVWESEMKLAGAPGIPAMDLKLKSRLLELSDDRGRKCAKIRSTFGGPFTVDLSQVAKHFGIETKVMESALSASMQGSIVCRYDYENNLYLSQEGILVTTMSFTPPGSLTSSGSIKMTGNFKITLAK
jgi:hypothetical protein